MTDATNAQAQRYLDEFNLFIEELISARDLLAMSQIRAESDSDINAEIRLRASVAYFERFVVPLMARNRVLKSRDISESEDIRALDLPIDGSWRAFEFRQMFNGFDYLNKLYTIRQKLASESPDFRLRSGMTRSPVVRKSLLHFYLASREELRVRRVRFASPGIVSFEGLGEVIKEIRETFNYVVTGEWVKRLVNNFHELRDTRGRAIRFDADRAEEEARRARATAETVEARVRIISANSQLMQAIQTTRQQYRQLIDDDEIAYVRTLRDAQLIAELEARGLADSRLVESEYITSLSQLKHLSDESKIGNVDGSQTRDPKW